MNESNPYKPPRSELGSPIDRRQGPGRSRRIPLRLTVLAGALVGFVAGALVPVSPLSRDQLIIWFSEFVILGGIAGAAVGALIIQVRRRRRP
jgi:hypothetical protein